MKFTNEDMYIFSYAKYVTWDSKRSWLFYHIPYYIAISSSHTYEQWDEFYFDNEFSSFKDEKMGNGEGDYFDLKWIFDLYVK